MKAYPSIPIAVLLLFMLCCAQSAQAEHFRVMLHSGSFPPYFFKEEDQRTGTIRDIFEALTKETGDTIEYVRTPFQRAILMFETGEIDIEPMTTPEWRQSSPVPGVFSIPYTTSEELILFRSGKEFPLTSPEEMIGKTIGVVQGYHYPLFDPFFSDKNIQKRPLQNEEALIHLLLADRIDQVLINKDYAQYQIKEQHLDGKLSIGYVFSKTPMMIRFHPSKKDAVLRFNHAIEKLINDGTIQRIYENYR